MLKTVFDKETRQRIVEDFARRHGGQYDAAMFFDEVKSMGKCHPAYDWFEWDKNAAAREHNLLRARQFANDLTIKFEVQEVHHGKFKIVQREAPMVLSPIRDRIDGGGYFVFDPDNTKHTAELCHQAATAMSSWLKRYGSCLSMVGGPVKAETLEALIDRLANAS